MIVGLIIGVIYIFEDQNKLPSWHWPAFNALLLIPAFYAAIAVHEMGHLVLGLLAGLDMGGIAVGGFLLLKSGENWVFRFDRMWIGGGFFKPLMKATNFRASRCAWMVAGGPGEQRAHDRLWGDQCSVRQWYLGLDWLPILDLVVYRIV